MRIPFFLNALQVSHTQVCKSVSGKVDTWYFAKVGDGSVIRDESGVFGDFRILFA